MRSTRLSWALTCVLLAVSVAVVALAYYPGLTNPDSNQTISQAQQHIALDWWSPFGSLALRAWNRFLGFGLDVVWITQVAIFVVGAWLLLRHVLPLAWAAAGALLVTVWPPTYNQLSELARDPFFMAFALVALGALGEAYRAPEDHPRRRWAWLAVALIAAMLSYLSRQNGVVVVIGVVLGGLPLVARSRIAGLSRWRRVAGGIVVAGATGLLAFAFSTAMNRAFGVTTTHPERMLYVYDLASISKLTGHDQFPPSLIAAHRPGWVTPVVDQRTIEREFNWINVISMYPNDLAGTINFGDSATAAAEARGLRGAWRRAVENHPAQYLWTRLRLTASILGFTNHPLNAYYGLLDPTNYGRPLRFRGNLATADDVTRVFVGPLATIPLDVHWPYLLVSIGFTIFLWRRRPGDRPLLVAIATAQWLNLAVDFFFAPASSYSYADLDVPLALTLALWSAWTAFAPQQRAGG